MVAFGAHVFFKIKRHSVLQELSNCSIVLVMMLSELSLNDTNLLVLHSSRLLLFPLIFILFKHNPFFALSWSGLGLGKAL